MKKINTFDLAVKFCANRPTANRPKNGEKYCFEDANHETFAEEIEHDKFKPGMYAAKFAFTAFDVILIDGVYQNKTGIYVGFWYRNGGYRTAEISNIKLITEQMPLNGRKDFLAEIKKIVFTDQAFKTYLTQRYQIKWHDIEVIDRTETLLLVKKFDYRFYVYEKGLTADLFTEIGDFRTMERAAKHEFERRKNETVRLSIDEMFELIEDENLRDYLKKEIHFLRNNGLRFHKLNTEAILKKIGDLTLEEFIELGKASKELSQLGKLNELLFPKLNTRFCLVPLEDYTVEEKGAIDVIEGMIKGLIIKKEEN